MLNIYGNSQEEEIILTFMYEPALSVGESLRITFERGKGIISIGLLKERKKH